MACFETGRQFHCLLLYQGKIATDRLAGIREGTVIAALLVGFIDRLIGKKLAFLKDMIFPESVSAENKNEAKEQPVCPLRFSPDIKAGNEIAARFQNTPYFMKCFLLVRKCMKTIHTDNGI